MIFCTRCGTPHPTSARLCTVCGSELPRTGATPSAAPPSTPPRPPAPDVTPRPAPAPVAPAPARPVAPARLAAFGAPPRADALGASDRVLLFLGNVCLSPILGAVLYFVWRDSRPTRARQVCTLTWWAVGVWGVFFLLMVLGAVASEL